MATGAGKSSPGPNHTETLPTYGVFRGTPFLRSIPFDSVRFRTSPFLLCHAHATRIPPLPINFSQKKQLKTIV